VRYLLGLIDPRLEGKLPIDDLLRLPPEVDLVLGTYARTAVRRG